MTLQEIGRRYVAYDRAATAYWHATGTRRTQGQWMPLPADQAERVTALWAAKRDAKRALDDAVAAYGQPEAA
jgi:hypothetical protein